MHNAVSDSGLTRNAILADALGETVAELCLIELGDMVAYIRAGQWANIADLVQSSTELSFIEGTMAFACSADVQLGWDKPTSISLDMEFQVSNVSAFFTLTLGAIENTVEIKHVWFAVSPENDLAGTRVFARALESALLRPRAPLRIEWPPL